MKNNFPVLYRHICILISNFGLGKEVTNLYKKAPGIIPEL